MKSLCVIPARLNSTRLPRKMLAKIGEQTMIEMTHQAAQQCKSIDRVLVATDSEEIAAVIQGQGGEVVMTPAELQTGSDRVAFVAQSFPDYEIIINLQGDEPFIKPEMLSQLIEPFFHDAQMQMSTLAYDLNFAEEYQNPNIVKVILDQHSNAIYFSRSPIPFIRVNTDSIPVLHHMGLYGFRRDFLLKFTQLPQTPLEKIESLEQLRALENGHKIRVCKTAHRTLEINTPEELAAAQKFILSRTVIPA